jgi:hypothetical protein
MAERAGFAWRPLRGLRGVIWLLLQAASMSGLPFNE